MVHRPPLLLAGTLYSLLALGTGHGSAAGCGPIGCGQTNVGGIGAPQEVDCHTFHALQGDVVAITVASSQIAVCWRLLGPDQQPVGDAKCNGQGRRALAATGTYTIEVTAENPGR